MPAKAKIAGDPGAQDRFVADFYGRVGGAAGGLRLLGVVFGVTAAASPRGELVGGDAGDLVAAEGGEKDR